jgi:hypothetical protein
LWGTATASAAGAFETRFFFGGELELLALRVGASLGRPITPAINPSSFSAFFRAVRHSSRFELCLLASAMDARRGEMRLRLNANREGAAAIAATPKSYR